MKKLPSIFVPRIMFYRIVEQQLCGFDLARDLTTDAI